MSAQPLEADRDASLLHDRTVLALTDRDDSPVLRLVTERCGARGLGLSPDDGAPAGQLLERSHADVTVLDGSCSPLVRTARSWRHFRWVAWEVTPRTTTLRAAVATARHVARGRLRLQGLSRWPLPDGSSRWFCVTEVASPLLPSARRYISPELGVDGFLTELERRGVAHAVLRWFDTLPVLEPGEDLDLLVADEHLPAIEDLLAERPGTIPCDLYTASGLPGTDYHAMAYLPPRLARRVLDRSVLLRGRYRVPCPEDALLSLAYHAVYHKGHSSGLPAAAGLPPVLADPEHDYASVLRSMGADLGLDVPLDLEELDAFLTERGWRPPADTLERLTPYNEWLAARRREQEPSPEPPGLVSFVLRQAAVDHGFVPAIVRRIVDEGFQVLACEHLEPDAVARMRDDTRGGNWGRGPFPVSGGDPAVLVFALDVLPVPPEAKVLAQFPGLDNERILVKEEVRRWASSQMADDQQCNVLHTSDNSRQALEYLHLALPERAAELTRRAAELRASFAPARPGATDLTRWSRRARVELVHEDGKPVVHKTFRPGAERFFERELTVARDLAAGSPHLLPLVRAEGTTVVTPWLDNTLRFDRREHRMLPLRAARAAVHAARYLHEQGYALIDFTPANLIVPRQGEPVVIDHEFLCHCPGPQLPFDRCWDIAGPPPDFDGDLPVNPYGLGWRDAWLPYVGVTARDLLERPAWWLHAARLRYRLLVVLPRRFRAWLEPLPRRTKRRARRVLSLFLHPRRRRAQA